MEIFPSSTLRSETRHVKEHPYLRDKSGELSGTLSGLWLGDRETFRLCTLYIGRNVRFLF